MGYVLEKTFWTILQNTLLARVNYGNNKKPTTIIYVQDPLWYPWQRAAPPPTSGRWC